jgi:hypothetical protein
MQEASYLCVPILHRIASTENWQIPLALNFSTLVYLLGLHLQADLMCYLQERRKE